MSLREWFHGGKKPASATGKKYELVQNQQIVVADVTLYRIRALKDFGKVKAGELGALSCRKIAVFIDGDFWHGNPRKYRIPKSNCDYWEQKIERNRKRDREVNKELRNMGWHVLRIWESSLKDEEAVIARLQLLL